MAEIVNLRQAKKARARADARAQGDANATKFGRTKAERSLELARLAREQRNLDAHLREPTED
ncbi:MAG: DUF4169 family protein [Rhodobacteraceae bacterium]|nr:DUF4169 family protein [Paracoccaceae bacterium]